MAGPHKAVRVFKVLSVETRVRMIEVLKSRSCTPEQILICRCEGQGHPCTDSNRESEKSKD